MNKILAAVFASIVVIIVAFKDDVPRVVSPLKDDVSKVFGTLKDYVSKVFGTLKDDVVPPSFVPPPRNPEPTDFGDTTEILINILTPDVSPLLKSWTPAPGAEQNCAKFIAREYQLPNGFTQMGVGKDVWDLLGMLTSSRKERAAELLTEKIKEQIDARPLRQQQPTLREQVALGALDAIYSIKDVRDDHALCVTIVTALSKM